MYVRRCSGAGDASLQGGSISSLVRRHPREQLQDHEATPEAERVMAGRRSSSGGESAQSDKMCGDPEQGLKGVGVSWGVEGCFGDRERNSLNQDTEQASCVIGHT